MYVLQDDEKDDPQWSLEDVIAAEMEVGGVKITADDVDIMSRTSECVFEILERAWASIDCALIDMKIEFGVNSKGMQANGVQELLDSLQGFFRFCSRPIFEFNDISIQQVDGNGRKRSGKANAQPLKEVYYFVFHVLSFIKQNVDTSFDDFISEQIRSSTPFACFIFTLIAGCPNQVTFESGLK